MRVLNSIILVLWILALVRTIANLIVVRKLRVTRPASSPLVSVIVPARNEERAVEGTVRALLAQDYPSLEVIVVDDRSADATGTILARLAAEDARLIVLHGEEPPPGWLGKPWALHQGASRAGGDVLLFVDADVVYQPPAIASAVEALESSGAAMVSLFPRLGMRGFWEHIAMPNLAVFGFMVMDLWLSNRSRSPKLAIGGGPGNLVRREAYQAAGGHEALKDAVVDDVALARLLRRSGQQTVVVRADDFVYVRMYRGLREVVDGFTKNCFATFGRSYALAALLIVLSIVLHVYPYAAALTGDVVAIATVIVIAIARLVLFVPLGYRIDNAIFGNPLMVLLWLYILVRSTWITGIRRQLHWRGRMYDAGRTRFGAD
jgi:chlorobactene glucosyltransferase